MIGIGISLIIIIVIVIIIGILIIILSNQKTPVKINPEPDQSNLALNYQTCRDINGLVVPNKLYTPFYDLTIQSIPIVESPSPNSLCLQFCNELSPELVDCQPTEAENLYTECIDRVKPGQAFDIIDGIAYYAIGRGRVGCYLS